MVKTNGNVKKARKGAGLLGDMTIAGLMDALPFYTILVDEEHHILVANRQVRAALGVEPEEIIGGYCPKVIHGTEGAFEGCPLEEAAEKGKAIEREVQDKKTGRWLLSAIYPTPARTPNGRRIFFHMVTDITDRRLAEEQLKTSGEKLRQLSADLESLREEERKKIARDLHDETSQLLASLSAHLEAAASLLPTSEKGVKAILRNAQNLSSNIIDQLQRITYELRPLVLDDLGLISAIGWLVDNSLKAAGVKAELITSGKVKRLDRQLETTLFRVIQEAVNNIARHASATRVIITLNFLKNRIKGEVQDDGVGFNPEKALREREGLRGLGLLGMKERIELMNGKFSLMSKPGAGTRVNFEIQIPRSGHVEGDLPLEAYRG